MKITVSTKGRLVLPAELRNQDGIEAGQQFEVERLRAGKYLLTRVVATKGGGIVDWLLLCPEKDWFQAVPSESTDQLKVRSSGDKIHHLLWTSPAPA